MGTLRNKVQLIGYVGQEPDIIVLENGILVARFSLATHAYFKDGQGEKQTRTYWHRLVAWGQTAEDVELDVFKGMRLAIEGRLMSYAYMNKQGMKCYGTEVLVQTIVCLEHFGGA